MKKSEGLVLLVLIVGLSGLALSGHLTRGHMWAGDYAAYIMQADSIIKGAPGAFVEANRFTVEGSSLGFGPTAYPWGFPVLLAPIHALFGLNPLALKAVGVISYLLLLVLLWFAFRTVHTTPWLFCLGCLFALNPNLLKYADRILSDLPFLLVSTLCVVFIQYSVVQNRRFISRVSDSVLIGATIAAAFFIRTNGVLLLITLGLSQLISHLQKEPPTRTADTAGEGSASSVGSLDSLTHSSGQSLIVRLLPYAVSFSLFAVWEWILPNGGASHFHHVKDISISTISDNLRYYFELPSRFFSGVPHAQVLYGASIPAAVVGAVRRYRSDYPALIYVALTIVFYVCWPATQGIRYILPILPFYLSFTLSGLEAFGGGTTAVERGFRRALCYVPVFLVILFFGLTDLRAVYRNIENGGDISDGPFSRSAQEMFSFVRTQTESDSVVVFFRPRAMRLMTGRRSVMVERVDQLSRGDYLCLSLQKDPHDRGANVTIEGLIAQGAVQITYETDDFKVYRLMEPHGQYQSGAFQTGG